MTYISKSDIVENAKWRAQADKIADLLKGSPVPYSSDLKVGIAFQDAIITIPLEAGLITLSSVTVLADHIYSLILLYAQTGGRA